LSYRPLFIAIQAIPESGENFPRIRTSFKAKIPAMWDWSGQQGCPDLGGVSTSSKGVPFAPLHPVSTLRSMGLSYWL